MCVLLIFLSIFSSSPIKELSAKIISLFHLYKTKSKIIFIKKKHTFKKKKKKFLIIF
jgi:hypothetical protein